MKWMLIIFHGTFTVFSLVRGCSSYTFKFTYECFHLNMRNVIIISWTSLPHSLFLSFALFLVLTADCMICGMIDVAYVLISSVTVFIYTCNNEGHWLCGSDWTKCHPEGVKLTRTWFLSNITAKMTNRALSACREFSTPMLPSLRLGFHVTPTPVGLQRGTVQAKVRWCYCCLAWRTKHLLATWGSGPHKLICRLIDVSIMLHELIANQLNIKITWQRLTCE